MVELVIKIDEEIMEYIKNNGCLSVIYIDKVAETIKNGTPLETEFEKIRTKIEELKPNNPNFKHFIGETRSINNALAVIDNHIAELKGEQK